MNLYRLLLERQEAGRPVTVGLIGAGKYGTMFLAQARTTPGLQIVAVADLDASRAARQLASCNWPSEQYAARSCEDAIRTGGTYLTDSADEVIGAGGIEVVIEATGDPRTGIRLALAAIAAGKHVVMVNVEADVVAGPLLARRAKQAGVVYALAYGDQPAIVCEHVDWARACGFRVVAAGKGTRYLPRYHQSTPDTVFDNLPGLIEIEDRSSINPKMFNSFVDGTKSAIEMTAIANATGLKAQPQGLAFPPASRFELADVLRPKAEGGSLAMAGVTECVSSLARDGSAVPHNLAHGTFVVIEAAEDSAYTRECFREYHMLPDSSGRYAALYRPVHFSGLELGISAAWAALLKQPTGAPTCFSADVVATAKRDLKAGETLDGEGGYCVWGRQTPAEVSLSEGYLPLGLAQHVKLTRDVPMGSGLRWDDVAFDADDPVVRLRREMEAAFDPRAA
ncbi:NAD(P)H-dependent oxidoreductase [Methylobacterium sp. NEAU K]|uniref:NAD(P)H-dependent oxidoreductase n=1 Tax=Methylobacterium sp. NEAU K TaxID=3064946 RepID=UPI00273256C1|nr:Gfo/Idh/MocA family oxidoreductase [Methylobacterium sp. NEAU K]MDP4003970.1 Gfo/Idh/MocA family oxidoreductase [Methylobacterium sp. NEAU K]